MARGALGDAEVGALVRQTLPFYYQKEARVWSAISDKHLSLLLPVLIYWVTSLAYHALDVLQPAWSERFRMHPPEQVAKRNRVTMRRVIEMVLLQHAIQTVLGLIVLEDTPSVGAWRTDVHPEEEVLRVVSWLRAAYALVVPGGAGRAADLLLVRAGIALYWWGLPWLQFWLACFIMDAWQYALHRLMHEVRFLYRHLHSHHHRLYVPYAFGALYNHPLEGLLLDTAGAALAQHWLRHKSAKPGFRRVFWLTVLLNLLANAVKFTARGHVALRLDCTSAPDGLRLMFEVEDTGIGIAADRLERIFDPFAQADASMSRRFGGTGLGTTISRQLVELMGGRIRVESELGVGSRFIVELPLSAGQGIERPRERRQAPRLPPLRILAADDVAQNLELLVLNLERLGHQVATVADGEAAVERFTREPFDLVLMDVQMPGTDGLEASRRIRAWEQREQRVPVPIIALTASVLDRDRQDALDAGMNGFASKPLEMSALVAEMAGVLGLAATVQAAPTSSDGAQGLFDWVRGARLWGGPLPMAAAIARFLEEQADLEPLRAALQQEDFNGLEQLAHRLRGVAGNLGLVKLSQAAFNLEQAAHAGAAARCSELIEVWTEAFAAVRTALPLQPEAAAMPVASVDTAQLLLALQSLSAELQRGGLDEAALRLLEQGLPEAQNEMRAVRQAVDDFEFEQALEHLRAVRQLLSREIAE